MSFLCDIIANNETSRAKKVPDSQQKEYDSIQEVFKLRLEMGDCKVSIRDEMQNNYLQKKEFYRLISVVVFVAAGTVGLNNYMNKEVSKTVTEKFEKATSEIVKAINKQ